MRLESTDTQVIDQLIDQLHTDRTDLGTCSILKHRIDTNGSARSDNIYGQLLKPSRVKKRNI